MRLRETREGSRGPLPHLIQPQMLSNDWGPSQGFGGGYETTLLCDGKFVKLQDHVFIAWNAILEPSTDDLRIEFNDKGLAHKYLDDLLVFRPFEEEGRRGTNRRVRLAGPSGTTGR